MNTAVAEPRGAYNQQANHAPSRGYAREHRRGSRHELRVTHHGRIGHSNSYFYGGGVNYSSWNRHHNRGHHGYRNEHSLNGNVALGVGLGLLTYQIMRSSQPRHQHHYVQRYTQPVAPRAVVYVQQPQARSNCLQEREYQTIVVIAGQEKQAYGTACLQADGSWMQGPATIEPSFR
jgi:hypothetical protein